MILYVVDICVLLEKSVVLFHIFGFIHTFKVECTCRPIILRKVCKL